MNNLNLVNNGSFSNPEMTSNGYLTVDLNNYNWSSNRGVTYANFDVSFVGINPIPTDASFSQFLFMYNAAVITDISQNITFPKEGFYSLSFWTSARAGGNPNATPPTPNPNLKSTLTVSLGNLVNQTITYTAVEWKKYTYLIRIGGGIPTQQTLRFTTNNGRIREDPLETEERTNCLSGISITYVDDLCFKEGTLITCLHPDNHLECHVPIEELVSIPYSVKTLCHGYLPIKAIGKSVMKNPSHKERIKDRLYELCTLNYPELYKPLYITGCHGILVDYLTEEEKQKCMDNFDNKVYTTDGKYRLFACLDKRAEPWSQEGSFNIYHLALESEDITVNHGIYANGLLIESCPIWSILNRTNNMEIMYEK